MNQTLVQGIINNLNDLQARLTAVNPSGTTLSGSSVCIGVTCKSDWSSVGGGGGSLIFLQNGEFIVPPNVTSINVKVQ